MPPLDSKGEIELEITGNVELDLSPGNLGESNVQADVTLELDLKADATIQGKPGRKNRRHQAETEVDLAINLEPKAKTPTTSKGLKFWVCLLWILELIVILTGSTAGIIYTILIQDLKKPEDYSFLKVIVWVTILVFFTLLGAATYMSIRWVRVRLEEDAAIAREYGLDITREQDSKFVDSELDA